jgi:tetratricopeptide (TPR) repeat protein
MAKISLRMYNREIEGLVEQGQRLDEAIAHCRHILQTYPKHLETYRLLGKAYLEAKRYDQAVDIFQRVLVAAPDDFVSHVGMSIIADDKGKLDDAIWHMERAFEVQPSNAAIQGELQRLFGRRDGMEPPKIRLTRGALAHMYVQGELYNQAISEIRAVLANDPRRTDMQTLLARAYFRNGQKAEAAEICTELLSKYPYCLDANRLMIEIVPGTQRADTGQEYRQRVIELDPYAAFVQDSVFHANNVADNLVTLERLEYTGETAEMPPSLGIGLDTDGTLLGRVSTQASSTPLGGQATPADLPAWLRGTANDSASQGRPASAAPAQNKDDLPDFLRHAGWGTAAAEAAQEAPSPVDQPADIGPAADAAVEGDLPAWVKALAPTGAETAPVKSSPSSGQSDVFQSQAGSIGQSLPADTPDWLRNLGEEEPARPAALAPESPLPAAETPSLPADAPDWLRGLGPVPSASADAVNETPEETPDWLKNLAGRELDEPAAPVKNESETDWLGSLRAEQASTAPVQPEQEESPDWLKEFGNDLETPIAKAAPAEPPAPKPSVTPEPSATLGSLGTTAREQDDAMAWLEGLAAKHGAKPEELVTDPNARTEVAPEWVDKAKEIGEQPPEPAPLPAEDETGMWLRNLQADVDKAPVPEPTRLGSEDKPFDLRSGFTDQNEFTGGEAEAAKEQPPIKAGSETPDWLNEFAAKPADRLGMQDAPDWLRGTSKEEPEDLAKPYRAEADNIPSELAQGAPEVPTPTREPPRVEEGVSDLPAWLAGLEQEEPATTSTVQGSRASDELPAWLQAETEPEPAAKEPANPADWHPAQPAEVQPPAAEAISQQVVEPRPEPVAEERPAPPPPVPVRVEKAPMPTPAPARPKPVSVSVAPKAATLSLGDAQFQLGRGNIAAALDIYGKLIRKGKSLEDIIRDLRDALYRYPVEVPLWQSLGDAYMRANRLQEALDAYTKAEELLR